MIMGGTRLLRIGVFIASFFLLIQNGNSQEIGFSLNSFVSPSYNLIYEPGMNGGGISIFYNRQKFKRLNLSLSGEYAMSTWGHQTFVGLGINRTWVEWERFGLNTYGHLLNGLAFYKPKPLYVFGVDTRIVANFYIRQKLKVFIGTGIRYTLCPGYSKYGLIETSLDIPLEIGMKYDFRLKHYSPKP